MQRAVRKPCRNEAVQDCHFRSRPIDGLRNSPQTVCLNFRSRNLFMSESGAAPGSIEELAAVSRRQFVTTLAVALPGLAVRPLESASARALTFNNLHTGERLTAEVLQRRLVPAGRPTRD